MGPNSRVYSGNLATVGGSSYLVASGASGNPTWTLLMWDANPPSAFSLELVTEARDHYYPQPDGTPIRVQGFLTQEDADGAGTPQFVLHIVQDLSTGG